MSGGGPIAVIGGVITLIIVLPIVLIICGALAHGFVLAIDSTSPMSGDKQNSSPFMPILQFFDGIFHWVGPMLGLKLEAHHNATK